MGERAGAAALEGRLSGATVPRGLTVVTGVANFVESATWTTFMISNDVGAWSVAAQPCVMIDTMYR